MALIDLFALQRHAQRVAAHLGVRRRRFAAESAPGHPDPHELPGDPRSRPRGEQGQGLVRWALVAVLLQPPAGEVVLKRVPRTAYLRERRDTEKLAHAPDELVRLSDPLAGGDDRQSDASIGADLRQDGVPVGTLGREGLHQLRYDTFDLGLDVGDRLFIGMPGHRRLLDAGSPGRCRSPASSHPSLARIFGASVTLARSSAETAALFRLALLASQLQDRRAHGSR